MVDHMCRSESSLGANHYPIQFVLLAAALFCLTSPAIAQTNVSIVLTQPLTDTGIQVVQGETYTIRADGELNWFTGSNLDSYTTPDGDPWSTCESFTPAFQFPGL